MQCDVPTGWSVKPLEKIATLQRGFDLPVQEREEGNIPVYGSNGIDGWHSHAAVSGPGVITGRSGTIGPVYFEMSNYWPLNTTLYVRDFHGNKPRFVARMLESLDLKRFAASTGVPSLNRNFVHPTPVLLPSPDEQSRIAGVLDTADEAIAKTEAVIAKLKQVRAGLLHDLLTRGLDEHGQLRDPMAYPEQFQDSPLGRIPLEWEVQSLESVTDPSTPICYGIVQAMEFVPDGVPVLTIRDLLGDYSTGLHRTARNIDASYARSRVRPDDVLISVKGTIGRVAVVPQHFQGNISRDLARIRPNDRVQARFLVHLLRSPRGQRILEQARVGTTRAELSIAPLKRLRFAFPLPAEQERIAMILDEQDALIRSHEQEFAKLGELKSGLMTDLLKGRVRVPESISVVENQP